MQPLFGGRRLPTHATRREYSRLKVPNVLANSRAEIIKSVLEKFHGNRDYSITLDARQSA